MRTASPEPSAAMLERSSKLSMHIREEIYHTTSQQISFARFMELALLHPHLGYYNGDHLMLGAQGDFTTAPEISSLFSHCLANYCQPIIQALPEATVLEIGAGTGRMAADILLKLETENALPKRYIIVEISHTLRLQQQHYLQQRIPHLMHLVEMLDQLPKKPINGIILANEVIDTLPVYSFAVEYHHIQERFVGYNGHEFVWQIGPPELSELTNRLNYIKQTYLSQTSHYVSETRLSLEKWLTDLKASLRQGCIMLIDYGFVGSEYYHPQRTLGTLRCHYQQARYNNPLNLVGLQDITSDVDFTQLGNIAIKLGFQIEGFMSQAAFLLACNLLRLKELCYNSPYYLKIKGQIHQLLSPNEMGELCKVLIIQHQYTGPKLNLSLYNRSESLKTNDLLKNE